MSAGRRHRLQRPAEHILLGALPLATVFFGAILLLHLHEFAVDFRSVYWPAGHRVLNGLSPYTGRGLVFPYPAPGALLLLPFALLPHAVANWVFTAVVIGAVFWTLRLLEIRDWRVYGIVLLWQPVFNGWETANLSLLVLLGLTVVWRYRDTPAVSGAVLGLVVSVKLFVFPMGIWLLATRRYRATGWAVGVGAAANIVSWALLGFDQIGRFSHVLSTFAVSAPGRVYGVVSIMLSSGATKGLAEAVGIGLGLAVTYAGLRYRGADRDRILMSACVFASLLASPVVESHYLTLLILPLALARPTLAPVWALPILLWITPADHPAMWQRVVSLCIASAVAVLAIRAPEDDVASAGSGGRTRGTGRLAHGPGSTPFAHRYRPSGRRYGQMGPSASPKLDLRDP